ncbi:MAG: penicillin-binding transpeptidase domain-containing protein [Oscillospiraceae bacterium]|nr:penicillin-binding transpeptidase domain-containing protein [Oscillospiraceae bacterium]
MEKRNLIIRLIILGLMSAGLVFLMGGRLLGLQFIHADVFVQTQERITSRSVTLHAARGEIYDRYGRPLATNKLSFNMTLDPFGFFIPRWEKRDIDEREFGYALALIRDAQACGVPYAAPLLPVTPPPFGYTEMTEAQERYLAYYLEKKGWPDVLTAAELMDRLFDEYGMTGEVGGAGGLLMSAYEARLAAGVLYELDLRYEAAGFPPYLHNVPAYTFAQDVSMDLMSRVSERGYPGIEIVPVTAREYSTAAAGHLLGRIGPIQDDMQAYRELGYRGDELVGVEGAEAAFESWLRGLAGERTDELNSHGHVVGVTVTRQPRAGQHIYLTIDIRLQEALERALADGVATLNATGVELRGLEAEAAAAVIIDVWTGEVLAAANFPTYSPQAFMQEYGELAEDPLRPLFNRAIFGTYAPGSTFKMVTGAAAMESGTVTASTRIFDEGIYTHYMAPQPRCHIYPGSHGRVDAVEALKVSCNYYYYDIGRRTGIEEIVRWAHLFGLGLPTGFELEGGARTRLGWVAGPEASLALGIPWYPGNTLTSAIGQDNNQVTPLQLANYTAAIANGGTLNRAHLLKEALSFDYGYEYYVAQPEVLSSPDLAPSTVRALQQGMLEVTRFGGTAYSVFRDYPIAVAGKTGTAQIVDDRPNNGVFVCYAPYDSPQIALALVVEKGGAGSTIAFIARDILDIYFRLQEEMANEPIENSLQR